MDQLLEKAFSDFKWKVVGLECMGECRGGYPKFEGVLRIGDLALHVFVEYDAQRDFEYVAIHRWEGLEEKLPAKPEWIDTRCDWAKP